ncbi:hypothetical protein KJ865_02725, partial [Myxococcota bacterium]|nr:hypothetical protein [Myxococcota bacterium]
MKRPFIFPAIIILSLVYSCKNGHNTSNNTQPVIPKATDWTYQLDVSTPSLTLWTTPATHRVVSTERAPQETGTGVRIFAAKNEYEPFQIIADPHSSFSISVQPFEGLGTGASLQCSRAGFVSGRADALSPLDDAQSITATGDEPTVIWCTAYIPENAAPGEHTASLTFSTGDQSVVVPVTLYVFDFTLPPAASFATQLNVSIASLIPPGGSEEAVKDLLFAHRMTPKSVTWPSGFSYNITWENTHSTDICEIFWDEPEESPPYSIGSLSRKYILGEGWNGVGFPTAMLFQFVDNATPRPDSFCGISRGDHYGTAAYNEEWSQWLGALEKYLQDANMDAKGYYYVQNEPQNEEDHLLAAHLCQLVRSAAPG